MMGASESTDLEVIHAADLDLDEFVEERMRGMETSLSADDMVTDIKYSEGISTEGYEDRELKQDVRYALEGLKDIRGFSRGHHDLTMSSPEGSGLRYSIDH